MDRWMDGRREFLPILLDFVHYRGRCPKKLEDLETWLAGSEAWLTCTEAWLAGPEAWLAGHEAYLASPEVWPAGLGGDEFFPKND